MIVKGIYFSTQFIFALGRTSLLLRRNHRYLTFWAPLSRGSPVLTTLFQKTIVAPFATSATLLGRDSCACKWCNPSLLLSFLRECLSCRLTRASILLWRFTAWSAYCSHPLRAQCTKRQGVWDYSWYGVTRNWHYQNRLDNDSNTQPHTGSSFGGMA